MQRPTRTRRSLLPSSSASPYKSVSSRPLTNITLSVLFLSLLITTINATPVFPPPASPVLDAYLSKRSHEASSIHIPAGGVAGIVLSIIVVVLISVFLCCPCWKWTSRAGKREKNLGSSGAVAGEAEGARRAELGGREIIEMGPSAGDEVGTGQRIDKESPPGYDEVVGGMANTAGRSELDGKRIG